MQRMGRKTARGKALDIPQTVKREVWRRDEGRCVVCHNRVGALPNAHFIPRSRGGLGIPENIVTLCGAFTPLRCHDRFDNGTAEEQAWIGAKIEEYLVSKYPGWNREMLTYRKGR